MSPETTLYSAPHVPSSVPGASTAPTLGFGALVVDLVLLADLDVVTVFVPEAGFVLLLLADLEEVTPVFVDAAVLEVLKAPDVVVGVTVTLMVTIVDPLGLATGTAALVEALRAGVETGTPSWRCACAIRAFAVDSAWS